MASTQSTTQPKTEDRRPIEITRTIDAPPKAVFEAWSKPGMIKKWWGPQNFTAPSAKMDFRVGGEALLCMKSPDGKEMYSKNRYQEIEPGKRIVYIDTFADKDGNSVSAAEHGMSDFPMETKVTVTFEDAGGKTKLSMRHDDIPAKYHEECTKGWRETIEKLDRAVAKS